MGATVLPKWWDEARKELEKIDGVLYVQVDSSSDTHVFFHAYIKQARMDDRSSIDAAVCNCVSDWRKKGFELDFNRSI